MADIGEAVRGVSHRRKKSQQGTKATASLLPSLPSCLPSSRSGSATAVHQGRVVQRLNITIDIQWTNCYAVDSVLLGGQRYQTFEQLEPDKSLVSIDKRKV